MSLGSCPTGLDLIDGGCYSFSRRRVGWIEARKLCEEETLRLVSIETERKRDALLEHIVRRGSRRYEYWLSGNDIDRETVWQWAPASSGGTVPAFGWLEEPYRSSEENCLSWTVTNSRNRGLLEGWHGSSCCNNLRYICEL